MKCVARYFQEFMALPMYIERFSFTYKVKQTKEGRINRLINGNKEMIANRPGGQYKEIKRRLRKQAVKEARRTKE